MNDELRTEETPLFFDGPGGRSLFGFLHAPRSFAKTDTGIIFCHPFAEEKNMSHSVVVKAARRIAEQGYSVFRFDFSGCGDSEGEFGDFTILDWQEDLDFAIKFFQHKTGIQNYILWGLRLGAGIVLLQQEKYRMTKGLILWEPVLDFSAFIRHFFYHVRSQEITGSEVKTTYEDAVKRLEKNGVVHIIGYPIRKSLYENMVQIRNGPQRAIPRIPTLILSVSLMEQAPFKLKEFVQHLASEGTPVRFKHIMAEPFWNKYWQWDSNELIEVTLEWLEALG